MGRPPIRSAVFTALAVLAGYLVTMAPTVTFWDAGEFITAARTLGIPHPPGSPLFVLIAHVWGQFLPFGAYAWRINLLSACCSAAAAGFWFLIAHDIVTRVHHDIDGESRSAFATLGGVAAALLASFTFTTWQSATESEVYAAAMLAVAAVAWIAMRWRSWRSTATGARMLLLALYLMALSVGVHLIGLLVGPALLILLGVEARRMPLHDDAARREEWARIGVVGATWVVLVGVGLGNLAISLLGGSLFVAAMVLAQRARELRFALLAGAMVAAGVSTLVFLLLRARQHPWLDSGNPVDWRALVGVVQRAQYPVRTPFDDPTVMHGAGNPGRSLTLMGYQVANYAQYFDWQWAAAVGDLALKSWLRLCVTLGFFSLGIRGALRQRRADPASFWFVAMLFIVAGPALAWYLNFRPGPSIGWDRWLHLVEHEVRDRDYFFVASFVAWCIWVAIALADIARIWIPMVRPRLRPAIAGVFAAALVPLVCNARAATRRQTAEATMARDFAVALLQSAPKDAVLFTNGDNDTFPLWYAQQVERIRPDVTVICLSLAQTAWYIKAFAGLHGIRPELVDTLRPFRASREFAFPLAGGRVARIAEGAVVNPADFMVIELLRMNAGRRPVAWSISAADQLFGLAPELAEQGMALVLPRAPVDSASLVGGAAASPEGVRLDLATTLRLIDSSWTFGRLETDGAGALDANIQAVARTLTAPMTQAGIALAMRGDTAAAVRLLRRAVRLSGDSLAGEALHRLVP